MQTNLVWDDAASGGTLLNLRSWWDTLVERGPSFGYYPNPLKTYLMVKPDKRDLAENIFKGTKVQITSEGRRYLGGALGSQTFVATFMANKVADWSAEVRRLAKFAAHATFTHGLLNRWIYTLRVTNPLK